ncbi:uncharacterized protein LOC123203056 [Mangifera indica]|uniref:uncharacterized protein LOC123203056 n=1 Tax=Mangifera indica TaxID=29780 RepID=UPI001CFADF24|nr:uncharacterized protein LOC123203056 [Mangifera indica]
MKISGFWVLFFVLGTAVTFLSFPTGMVITQHSDGMMMMAMRRKLKENGYTPSTNKKPDVGMINLQDYSPADPAPSKATIKPAPIHHYSPLNPNIPRPSPPDHPTAGGST